MIDTHVLDRDPAGVRSPLEKLQDVDVGTPVGAPGRYAVEARSVTRWVPDPARGAKRIE
jgi:hypothetical protein